VADKKNTIENTLADRSYTVSDQLRFLGSTYDAYGGAGSEYGQARAWLGVDPHLERLPDVQAQAFLSPEGHKQGDVSIGYGDTARFTTGVRGAPEEGRTAFNRLDGQFGPLRLYGERSEGKQPFDTQTDLYGGTLNLGPFRLSGEQLKRITDREQEEIRKRVTLEGSYPVGTGILRGSLAQESSKLKSPQPYSFPRQTSANIGWGGRLGPAELLLQAQYNKLRGQNTEYRVEGGVRVPF
jgi:hypothetical protein